MYTDYFMFIFPHYPASQVLVTSQFSSEPTHAQMSNE